MIEIVSLHQHYSQSRMYSPNQNIPNAAIITTSPCACDSTLPSVLCCMLILSRPWSAVTGRLVKYTHMTINDAIANSASAVCARLRASANDRQLAPSLLAVLRHDSRMESGTRYMARCPSTAAKTTGTASAKRSFKRIKRVTRTSSNFANHILLRGWDIMCSIVRWAVHEWLNKCGQVACLSRAAAFSYIKHEAHDLATCGN